MGVYVSFGPDRDLDGVGASRLFGADVFWKESDFASQAENGSHALDRFRVGMKPHRGNSPPAREANEVMANATTLQKDSTG